MSKYAKSIRIKFDSDNEPIDISHANAEVLYPYPVVVVKADEPYTPPAPPKVAPPKYTAVMVWDDNMDSVAIRVTTGELDDSGRLYCYNADNLLGAVILWDNWGVLK